MLEPLDIAMIIFSLALITLGMVGLWQVIIIIKEAV